MADNYIEKRMAEIAAGVRTSAGSRNMGFDSLAKKSSASNTAARHMDPSYKIHPLQIAAILNAASLCAIQGVKAIHNGDGCIAIVPESGAEAVNMFAAGRLAQSVILKAHDMGLAAAILDSEGPVTIRIGHLL